MANDWLKSAAYCKKRMHARQMLLTVTPASSKVNEDIRRPSLAMPSTSSRTTPAPAKAATQIPGSPAIWRRPAEIAMTAPSDAPLDTPSV